MSRERRPGSRAGRLLALAAVGLPLLMFIAIPIVAMLVASFHVEAPAAPVSLMQATRAALEQVEDDPEARLAGWWAEATEPDRIAAAAVAFSAQGLTPPWDVAARWSAQSEGVAAALTKLDPAVRAAVEKDAPLAHASLKKRPAIAARLRGVAPETEVAAFRSGREWRWGLDNYAKLPATPRLREAARNSALLGLASATLVTTLGFALALGAQRRAIAGGAVVRALLLAPIVSPPVMLAMATLLLFGRQGLVTKTLLQDQLGLIDATHTNVYGLGGVLFAQTLGLIGPVFIVLSGALSRRDADLEHAAAALGASPARIFREVTLPMAWPGLARAFLLAFVLSLTDFGNPLVIGQGLPVLAAEIYGEIVARRDYPAAAALCVWLLLPAALLYGAVELAAGRRRYTVRMTTTPPDPPSRAVRRALTALAALVAGTIALLFAVVATSAFVRQWGVDYTPTLAHFRGERTDGAFAGTGFGTSGLGVGVVLDSLRLALLAAPLGAAMAVAVAYVTHRLRPPGAEALGFLALLPAVVPGLIFGLGYILAFNAPFGRPELALTGTLAVLVLNVAFGNLFVGVLAARAALAQLDASVEEAAESLGAGVMTRVLRVALPAILPAFLLGALYVFVDAMTTFSSVIFLVTGRWELASVEIFNQAGGAEMGSAAAKTVVILALALMVVGLLRVVERGQWRSRPKPATALS